MILREFYEYVHGDYDDVLTRLPSDDFILRFVKRFPTDPSYGELKEAVAKGDISASFEAAHKLKGLAGNLGFSELQNLLEELVEQLRPRTEVADMLKMEKVCESYDRVMEGISKLCDA